MARRRYAAIGVSNRNLGMFMRPILKTYKDHAELVAMLDSDRTRMAAFNKDVHLDLPCYGPDELDRLVKETRPDAFLIATPDAFHDHYIVEALKRDLDAVVEKPLTTDEAKCRAIAVAAAKSRGKVRVCFNYRYSPHATRIRELIAQGRIGRVVSLDLNWYLDTFHGSSYFQRWNRLREMSGGLSIHKACHHFDLLNWWTGQRPVEVFAYGKLNFYGPKGVHNPLRPEQIGDGRTCPTCDVREKCRYYMRWCRSEYRCGVGEVHDEFVRPSKAYENYTPRQCIFDPAINIEDTYTAVIRFDGGAFCSYTLNASVPYEGFRLGINGTEGRIEFTQFSGVTRFPFPDPGPQAITLIPMFGGRERVDVLSSGGGHGGGDPLLLDELFIGPDTTRTVPTAATLTEGIDAVLTGVAVHRSANEHAVISVEEMRRRVYAGLTGA